MGSSNLAEALQLTQTGVYGALFVVALIQWRRRPGPASAWLVATFGVLGAVVVAGQFLPEESTHPAVEWATRALLAVLVLFPYLLYRFTTSLVRPIPWVNVVGTVLTASLSIVAFLLPPFPEDGAPTPAAFNVYVVVLLVQWVFLSAAVAVRLWRAGKAQPTVARRRMRTMSLGATGLALALVLGGEFSDGGPMEIVVQFLVLAAAPLMLIGFAPPRMLRVAWRQREDAASRQAALSLMEATTTSEVAQTLLPHARKLLGAPLAILEDSSGAIVARDRLDGQADQGPDDPLDHRAIEALDGAVVSVPLRSGRLVVITSPVTPFFGNDELSELKGLAAQADLALARNELLDSQRMLAAIVESSDDAITSLSLDGTFTSWNKGAERIYGYRAEEVVGRPMSMLVPAERRDDVPMFLERLANGESIEDYETGRQTKDGRTIDVSMTISPIKEADGRVIGGSTIARDVSERRKSEDERELAREAADRANRAKSEFLSRMSHELRTPMNAVLGFAQLLELDHLSPEQQEATGEILKAGRHLLELIDEVLDIARIEAGRLRLSLEPVDAVAVAEESISLLTLQARQEGVTLSMEKKDTSDAVFVVADRQRLKQVMLNLISNGIKYNRQHGTVRVSIDSADGGSRIRIDVTDSGRGIPAERIEQLFAPFERLGAEETGIEGTGLGLALTKPLAEAMGGALSVVSEAGKGSTFSVELASAVDGQEVGDVISQNDLPAQAIVSTPRTILYVEDNLSNLKLMERVLARRVGITLLSAMQGSMGVTLARDHRPELILLDLNLPDMRGEEVLARLHSDPATADLPVVVISADATSGQRARLIEAGARDFITKPFNVDRLLQLIDEFCRTPIDAGAQPVGSSGSSSEQIGSPTGGARQP
ncbi:MAG TPA: PAS domain S-box protein [Actinomycetota bacterium]|nr:PAS domain S-box protein [Actinomycetota bacterium]